MSASLTIRWETISDLIADGLEDLAVAHWEEAEKDQGCPLDMDWDKARSFERSGALKVAALRRDGVLIGYAECMIIGGLFFRSTRHAYVQAIYVEPRFRGFPSISLLHWIETRIGEIGKTKVYLAAKTQRQCDFYETMGYAPAEIMFSKMVGANHHVEQSSAAALHSA